MDNIITLLCILSRICLLSTHSINIFRYNHLCSIFNLSKRLVVFRRNIIFINFWIILVNQNLFITADGCLKSGKLACLINWIWFDKQPWKLIILVLNNIICIVVLRLITLIINVINLLQCPMVLAFVCYSLVILFLALVMIHYVFHLFCKHFVC